MCQFEKKNNLKLITSLNLSVYTIFVSVSCGTHFWYFIFYSEEKGDSTTWYDNKVQMT